GFAAGASDGVNFVDKNDAGGFFLGFAEEVAHARGAHANKHFDEFGARNREKWHFGFSSHGLGHEGLPGAGRADQDDALGYFGTEAGKGFGVFEKVDDFHDLDFGFFQPGHVFKGHLAAVGVVEHLGA